jgi:(p)ppGpp synthase/HD superfamily hydrolase
MSEFLENVRDFCIMAHGNQKRKYTGAPYYEHCFEVAVIVGMVSNDNSVIAAALLHDVIEDTDFKYEDLKQNFGMYIAGLVLEVTDVSRPEDGNRRVRKLIDQAHLEESSTNGATIKLADIISNTQDIMQHDPNFAKVYLKEKRALLPLLTHGNAKLWAQANAIVNGGNI